MWYLQECDGKFADTKELGLSLIGKVNLFQFSVKRIKITPIQVHSYKTSVSVFGNIQDSL